MKKRSLICCCCGDDAGRWVQHYNRDTGYGVCYKCVQKEKSRSWCTESYILECYGKENINWGIAS